MGSRPGLWNIPGGIPPGIMEHPRWDPTRDYGTSRVGSHPGLWNIPCGIPPGIMEHPMWDPTRDYGTSRVGSHPGLWNVPHGIPPGIMERPTWGPHKSLLGSHLVNHIAGGIAPGILQILVWTLPKITDGFQLNIFGKILRGILPIYI